MSRRVLIALAVGVAAVTAPGAAAAGQPGGTSFGDDFERAVGPVGNGWLVGAATGPGPVIEGGQAVQGEPSNFAENLIWASPLESDALWVEVDMADASQDIMLVLHHDGSRMDTAAENIGYGLRWQPFDRRVVVLKDGEYRGPHPTAGGPYLGPHTLRAEWDGVDHLTLLVDGEQVMEWTDENPARLGGPDRRHVGVMFPPVNAPVHVEAIRGGSLGTPDAAEATPAVPTPATATATVVENEFIPEDRNLSDCISAVPRPGCGSDNRSGWRQWLVLGAIVGGLGVITWRIVVAGRRARSRAR